MSDLEAENERLRRRVAELEAELYPSPAPPEPPEEKPEPQRIYVVGSAKNPRLAEVVAEINRKHHPESVWVPVNRVDDVPECELWTPLMSGLLYRRENGKDTFLPNQKQVDELGEYYRPVVDLMTEIIERMETLDQSSQHDQRLASGLGLLFKLVSAQANMVMALFKSGDLKRAEESAHEAVEQFPEKLREIEEAIARDLTA